MKLASFASADGPRLAAWHSDQYVDLNAADAALPRSLKELFAAGESGIQQAAVAAAAGPAVDRAAVRWLAPIPDPQKVICIGLNYADHAAESGVEIPSEPVVFNKFPTAVRADGDPIALPTASAEVDYEAELVVVIGRGGKHIAEDAALSHVAGYTCGHDVSARDWQLRKPGGQWLLGKTFDSFAPFGPHMVTSDELPDPSDLAIRLTLNGQVMQDSRTSQLIFSIPQLIAYISGVCELVPGDVIFTGTPPGVGAARKPPVFLQPGDQVQVEIEGIGALSNSVVSA